MFMGPLQVSKPWQTNGLIGINRFLNRVWDVSEKEPSQEVPPMELQKVLHKTIKKVSQDTHELEFNTAISQMMIFINEVTKEKVNYIQLWKPFVLLIAPYAPHLAEEMWQKLGNKDTLAYEAWPKWVEELTKDDEKEIVVQLNGKVRAKMNLPAGLSKDELLKEAKANQRVQELLEGKTLIKEIAIPDKLVNLVVR
jgi:leucyl-tRNA synthetase